MILLSKAFKTSLDSKKNVYINNILRHRKLWFTNSNISARRSYIVLAIESSCDDSCIALIEKSDESPTSPPRLIKHVKESLDNRLAGGIIPLDARNFHQMKLAKMVKALLREHDITKPDLLCVTRGPGMIGSLSAGYNLGKGMAVAWDIPFIGVHHMLGHLLTPRFFQQSLPSKQNENKIESGKPNIPQYPFISLLVSGGHTMLVLSESVQKHTVLANTIDIAIGDALDKCGRELGISGNMIAREMEKFIKEETYTAEEANALVPPELIFPNPLQNKTGRKDMMAFSFTGFITSLRTKVEKYFPQAVITSSSSSSPSKSVTVSSTFSSEKLTTGQRRELAKRLQHAMFNHIVTKCYKAIELAIENGQLRHRPSLDHPLQFVCSGGVASNMVLREMLNSKLEAKFRPRRKGKFVSNSQQDQEDDEEQKNKKTIEFFFPPLEWCTDNALMIGWAGIELWESARLYTDLSALPTPRWPIEDLMNLDGWLNREN